MKQIALALGDLPVGFEQAKVKADAAARREGSESMLLAWYDAARNVGYPEARECTRGRPNWEVYAESHGANLRVEVNGGVYVFLFLVEPK
jgi:hypothetical protein